MEERKNAELPRIPAHRGCSLTAVLHVGCAEHERTRRDQRSISPSVPSEESQPQKKKERKKKDFATRKRISHTSRSPDNHVAPPPTPTAHPAPQSEPEPAAATPRPSPPHGSILTFQDVRAQAVEDEEEVLLLDHHILLVFSLCETRHNVTATLHASVSGFLPCFLPLARFLLKHYLSLSRFDAGIDLSR